MAGNDGDITELLRLASRGEADAADALWEAVYPELQRRARALFRSERADHTLSATGVVNETYVRLSTLAPREWESRRHFYAVAAGIMRHVLIDHARARVAAKRGSGASRQPLDESVFPSVAADEEGFTEAAQALEELAAESDRAALVVAMRVFGGLTVGETAAELEVSERTVKSDWQLARERLRERFADPTG